MSEAIRRTPNQEGIWVAFTSTNTLGKSLTHTKDSIPKNNAGQLAKLSCQDCTIVYIGENSRFAAHQEVPEKQRGTKFKRSSAIALHVLETEHQVDFDNPEILSKYWLIYKDRINAE